MLASTTSGPAKELVKHGLGERNGMVAFGRVRERVGKTAQMCSSSNGLPLMVWKTNGNE